MVELLSHPSLNWAANAIDLFTVFVIFLGLGFVMYRVGKITDQVLARKSGRLFMAIPVWAAWFLTASIGRGMGIEMTKYLHIIRPLHLIGAVFMFVVALNFAWTLLKPQVQFLAKRFVDSD